MAKCTPAYFSVPWVHRSPQPKQHLDRFSRFCRADYCDRATDRPTDHATRNKAASRYVRSNAMRPNNRPNFHYISAFCFVLFILCAAFSRNKRSWRWWWCAIKAKFHYASWFGASSEPASVMEFGFYSLVRGTWNCSGCEYDLSAVRAYHSLASVHRSIRFGNNLMGSNEGRIEHRLVLMELRELMGWRGRCHHSA